MGEWHEDHTSQAVYDALESVSRRDIGEYREPRSLPRVKIPGELAFFLDDLFDLARKHHGVGKSQAMAEVVDVGIIGWIERLDPELKRRLRIPVGSPSQAPLPEEPYELSQRTESPVSVVPAAAAEIDADTDRIQSLERRINDLESQNRTLEQEVAALEEDSAQPSLAQYSGDQEVAYTPLTTHSFKEPGQNKQKSSQHNRNQGPSKQQGRSGSSSNRRRKRKRR